MVRSEAALAGVMGNDVRTRLVQSARYAAVRPLSAADIKVTIKCKVIELLVLPAQTSITGSVAGESGAQVRAESLQPAII